MRIHTTTLRSGICSTPEFEKKGLASFAVNIGTKCGHNCLYCSSGAVLRMHKSFRAAGENPFEYGYAIVDPETPLRVARDARNKRKRGLIQLCTTVDAWSPEAQQYDLGRRCLEAILGEESWSVRILTKNVAVARDFDFISKHRDRVVVGLSITAMEGKDAILRLLEPEASPNTERTKVMLEAHEMGLRTYAMFCPVLPGISDDPDQIDEMIRLSFAWGAEEIFVEPANPRGNCLVLTENAMRRAGYESEANQVRAIRHRETWSNYTMRLLSTFQDALRRQGGLDKLRFLLYPANLTDHDMNVIRTHPEGVRWLGKDKKS